MIIYSDLRIVHKTVTSIMDELPGTINNFKVELALAEAINNAIIHGNQCCWEKLVEIQILQTVHSIRFIVIDEARTLKEHHLSVLSNEDLTQIDGRGLGIIKLLSDRFVIVDGIVFFSFRY